MVAGAEELPQCSTDPTVEAAGFCTVCRQPFAGSLLLVRTDGRAVCSACAYRDDIPLREPSGAVVARDPVAALGWLSVARLVALRPHHVFVQDFRGAPGAATRIGLLSTFLGFGVTAAWNYALGGDAFVQVYVDAFARAELQLDRQEVLSMIAASVPLSALLRFVAGALLFHAGAAVLGAGRARWEADLRAFALTSSTLVLCVVPVAGPMLALATWIGASLAYLRQRYGMPTLLALLSLLPSFLIIAALGPRTFPG